MLTMQNGVVLAVALSAVMFGLQACAFESRTASSQPPQYSENQSGRIVCANSTNTNCQAGTTQKYWGFLF
jgi:hypothetical protein